MAEKKEFIGDVPEHAISLDTATTWASNWKTVDSVDRKNLTSFLIPHSDMVNLLNEPGVVDARAYVGLRETDNQAIPYEFKLTLVGVDADGNDMFNPAQGEFIYDFTQPCPPMCATGTRFFPILFRKEEK